MSSPSISALTAGISFSAAMQAFTKNDMKPSLTPCFLSKASLWRFGAPMTPRNSAFFKGGTHAPLRCRLVPPRRPRPFRDDAEHRADLDGSPGLDADLGQVTGGGGVDLERDLVGLQLEHRLVDRDRVADRLEPFGDGRLGDRFAERRHDDLRGHGLPRLSGAAGGTSA